MLRVPTHSFCLTQGFFPELDYFLWLTRQMVPSPSSLISRLPSLATGISTGRPQTFPSGVTKLGKRKIPDGKQLKNVGLLLCLR